MGSPPAALTASGRHAAHHGRAGADHAADRRGALPAPLRAEEPRAPQPTADAYAATPQRPGRRSGWSTALYAGLRRGELQALRWSDIDLAEGVIQVERGWDERVGPVAPKS